MHTVGSYEAKTHLPELLRRVEAGERIRITRNGRPVADLVPSDPTAGAGPEDPVAELLRFGEGRALGPGLALRDLSDEGRW